MTPSSKAKVLTDAELEDWMEQMRQTGHPLLLQVVATIDALKAQLAQKTKSYHEASEQGIAAVSQMERNAVERDALRAELALKDKVVEAARGVADRGWFKTRDNDEANAVRDTLNDLDKVMAR